MIEQLYPRWLFLPPTRGITSAVSSSGAVAEIVPYLDRTISVTDALPAHMDHSAFREQHRRAKVAAALGRKDDKPA